MRRTLLFSLSWLFLLSVAAVATAASDPSPDPDANVVFLRIQCDVEGVPKENCFETTAGVTGWIWGTRTVAPSPGDEVLIDIGPGEFGPFSCTNSGYVTLRGSGREQTILADDAGTAVAVTNCEDLSFIDLGFRGGLRGVHWIGGGRSSWSNTDIVSTAAAPGSIGQAWYDVCDSSSGRSLHYFHGSRVRTTGVGSSATTPFNSTCGENWLFGGEILADLNGPTAFVWLISVFGEGDVRLFGTAARGRILPGGSVTAAYYGIYAPSGTFHAHGSIVNVSADGATVDTDVVGLAVGFASTAGFAHTPGTAWVLEPGGDGSATRVLKANSGSTASSPFLWQSGDTPPAIASQHGSDLFVETDCDATSCTGGSDPHLLIYSDNCPANDPWFDVVRQACRN